MLDRSLLAKSGVPFIYWGKVIEPGELSTDSRTKVDSLDPVDLYDSGKNVVILGVDPLLRIKVPSVLAQRFMSEENERYRNEFEHKRAKDDPPSLLDGDVFTQPFKVRMINADDLVDFWKKCDRDEDRSFVKEVCAPDIFFLTELGAEWPSGWVENIILELCFSREAEALPTIVTLATSISKKSDKNGERLYEGVTSLIRRWSTQGKVVLT